MMHIKCSFYQISLRFLEYQVKEGRINPWRIEHHFLSGKHPFHRLAMWSVAFVVRSEKCSRRQPIKLQSCKTREEDKTKLLQKISVKSSVEFQCFLVMAWITCWKEEKNERTKLTNFNRTGPGRNFLFQNCNSWCSFLWSSIHFQQFTCDRSISAFLQQPQEKPLNGP